MWRVVVCDQETSKNEEAKALYRTVENTTTMGCNARKQKISGILRPLLCHPQGNLSYTH
jgi:hypothetical protein